MTNPVGYQKQQIPAYSGVTINITSPTLNAAPPNPPNQCNCDCCKNHSYNTGYVTNPYIQNNPNNNPYIYNVQPQNYPINSQHYGYNNVASQQVDSYGYNNEQETYAQRQAYLAQQGYQAQNQNTFQDSNAYHNSESALSEETKYAQNLVNEERVKNNQNNTVTERVIEKTVIDKTSQAESIQGLESNSNTTNSNGQVSETTQNQDIQKSQQAYPAQYYLNNYNYIQGEKFGSETNKQPQAQDSEQPTINNQDKPFEAGKYRHTGSLNNDKEEDMSSSKEIISELDSRVAEQKELEKSGKKTKIIALTNEYIMSLENYLNNPNTEIRLMAAKEILTRFDEDKDRYNDAALNALVNKMLQDPEKLVRIAALSALSSQLASGNDFTVRLLNDIQRNPNSDKEDVLEAADILLKRSATTEIRYTPVQNNVVIEQKVE